MNYAEIKKYDIANGPGVRVSLFVSGCTIHCKGCFNPETWDPNFGKPFGDTEFKEIKDFLSKPYVQGLTILGGEPLDYDHPDKLYPLVHMVQNMPDKNVWIFTGHDLEWVIGKIKNGNDSITRLLYETDILVEGPFKEELKDPSLKFRGSKNQTIVKIRQVIDTYIKTGTWKISFSYYQSKTKTAQEVLRERLYLSRCHNPVRGLLGKVGSPEDE